MKGVVAVCYMQSEGMSRDCGDWKEYTEDRAREKREDK